MAFKHIRSIIREASTDQTLYTVPSGREFVLLRTRARYAGSSSGVFPEWISCEGKGHFEEASGFAQLRYNLEVDGNTYSYGYELSGGYYLVYPYDLGNGAEWVLYGWGGNHSQSPVGRIAFSDGSSLEVTDASGYFVESNVSVSFKVNSNDAFEAIIVGSNAVANGQKWKTLHEAGSTIKANATAADAMAEIMGIELKAGTWESVGGGGVYSS